MSQIGHPVRTIVVEPLRIPVPQREPAALPAPAPQPQPQIDVPV
jgi:hypothetical protein